MNAFAVLAPKVASKTLPDDIATALKSGAFAPAGLIECSEGAIPRWRSQAKRGNFYLSFETGVVYGCTSHSMREIAHVFEILGYDSLRILKGRHGKSQITIRGGKPSRLAGVLAEALGKPYEPEDLTGRLHVWLSTREATRLVIIALGDAHREPEGLDAIWTEFSARAVDVVRTAA